MLQIVKRIAAAVTILAIVVGYHAVRQWAGSHEGLSRRR
jgi:hypothetical protein